MAVETKQVRNTNFLKLLIEVESLIQAGYGIDHRGTIFNGIQFRVNMVRNSDVVSEESKVVDATTETKVSSEVSEAKVETPKNTTTKKIAKTKAPVNTKVEAKKDGE